MADVPHTDAPTRSPRRYRRAAAVVALPLLLTVGGLAGCGGDDGGGTTGADTAAPPSTSATTPAEGSATTGPTQAATTVEVTETEFAIQLSQTDFPAGEYTFRVANAGQYPHNLLIEGPGVAGQSSATFQGGQSGELTVTLQPGTYTLWCGVGNHRAQGMETTIQVS
jgi:plastocyanin